MQRKARSKVHWELMQGVSIEVCGGLGGVSERANFDQVTHRRVARTPPAAVPPTPKLNGYSRLLPESTRPTLELRLFFHVSSGAKFNSITPYSRPVPACNPYNKFTQPQFDKWTGDIRHWTDEGTRPGRG